MNFPELPSTLTSGIAVLLAGVTTTTTFATDRYWDPLDDNSYFSPGYTTYAGASVVWNNTNLAFDANSADPTNTAWNAGDDAFISLAPNGTPVAAPATNWFMRIGTAAPTVHNVTYDSATTSNLIFVANSTTSTAANIALTGGVNGASTWTVGAGDLLRLSSGGGLGGATNVGVVHLVNAAGVTTVDLVKEGLGRLHIQSNGSGYVGNVRINAGSLQINGNGSLGNVANNVYIAEGATLTANNNSTVAANRTIYLGPEIGTGAANLEAQGSFNLTVDSLVANNAAGIGSLTKTNSGTVTLNNFENSYTGVTTLSAGTLRVSNLANGGSVSALGASSSAASNLVLNSGTTLNFVAATASSTDRLFTIAGSTNVSNNSALSTSTVAWTNPGVVANTAVGAHSLTLGGTNPGTNIFVPALTDDGVNVLSLIKSGVGNWTVVGNHTYTGTTTIGDGSAGGTMEFDGNLTGGGGFVDVTFGHRLSGIGIIARSVFVSGTLAPGAASSRLGTLTVNDTLTLNGGGALAVNLAGSASSKVSGVTNLTLNDNTVTVNLDAANLPAGSAYDILEFSGTLSGLFNPAVAVAGLTGLTSRISFGLDYSAANKVRLTQTGQAKNLTWTGNSINPGTWNVNGAPNWNSAGAENFFDLDTVTFGDGAANRNVEVTTNVTPSAIVMNNTGVNDYEISASSGSIIGPASFTKLGDAKLTISGSHAFTGPFSIGGGTVRAESVDHTVAGPLGQGTLIFGGGGALEYTGTTASTGRPVEFAAGGGTVNVPSAVELTFSAPIAGAGGVTKTNDGTLVLPGNNGFSGPVLVHAGVLKLGNNNSLGTTTAGTTVSDGATLDLAATANTLALPQDEIITVSGGGVDLDGDSLPDGALVNYGTNQAQNAVKKVVLAGDAVFGGTQRFDIRIAGAAAAGFVPGTDAYFAGNGYNFTKTGPAILGIVGVGETDLADIEIRSGTVIFHDGGNSDAAMMLASDTTLGRVSDGAGSFYKLTIQPGATLQFFNSDGTRTKDIVANGVGTGATITMNSNAGVAHTLTLDRGIAVSGGLTLNSADAAETTLRVSGIISDGTSPGMITKSGGGIVVLTRANTFTGGATVTAGTLRIGHDGALGSGSVALNGGGLSSVGNASRQITNGTTIGGNVALGDLVDTGALTFANQIDLGNVARNLTIHSEVAFAGGFTSLAPGGLTQKLGTGTLRIGAGASTSGSVLEVRAGTLILETGAALASADAVRVMANTAAGSAIFSMDPGSSIEIGLGTANLRIGHESATITDGANIANIAGNFSFAAPTTGGLLLLGSDSALAQLNLLSDGMITARGIGLGGQTPAGAVTEFNFDGGALRALGDNSVFFPHALTAAKIKAGGGTIDTNGFSIEITQPLVHDPALGVTQDGGLSKTGPGTLTLNGLNTYTGPTVVDGGTLVVGLTGSILDSEITLVNPTGSLSGSGTIGALALNGGRLAPGTGIGTLTVVDNVDFGGGTVAFEINGINPGIDYDQFAASESGGSIVTISAPTELSLTLGFTPSMGDSFVLIKNNSTDPINTDSLFTFGGTAVPDDGEFNANGTTFVLHYDGGDGNDLAVIAVPEPTSVSILLGGLGILSGLRLRRA